MRAKETYKEIYRGDSWRNAVHFTQSNRTWENVEVTMKIRTAVDATPTKSLTAVVVVSGILVKAYFTMDATDTADLAPGEYLADVQFKADDFGTVTPVRYRITVTGDLT